MIKYYEDMTERDRRAVKIAVLAVVAILLYRFVYVPIDNQWGSEKVIIANAEAKLKLIPEVDNAGDKAKLAGLMGVVPIVDIPNDEESQRILFRNVLDGQLKRINFKVKSGPSYVSGIKTHSGTGYGVLKLQFRGTCGYTQLLDLIANLNSNPHYVGIEELKFSVDEKNASQMDVTMVVSTFVDNKGGKKNAK